MHKKASKLRLEELEIIDLKNKEKLFAIVFTEYSDEDFKIDRC